MKNFLATLHINVNSKLISCITATHLNGHFSESELDVSCLNLGLQHVLDKF